MPELSPEVLQRLRERAAPPPPKRSLPWVQIFFILVALAAGGWAYYQHWRYRLPQERDFTKTDGRAFHATLLSHNDGYAAFTLPEAAATRYLPIASLSPADQDFVRHTAATLTLAFPVDYVFTDAAGKETPVRLMERNSDWVKVTLADSHTQTFLAIDALSPADQDFVRLIPAYLGFNFPIDYILTGLPQAGASLHLLGHTKDYLEYQDGGSASHRLLPITSLSATDQRFVRALPSVIPFDYPFTYGITTEDGVSLAGLITNHNTDLVAIQPAGDTATRYYPIRHLSAESQALLRQLPGNLTISLPLDCLVDDARGQPLRMHITDRALDFLRYISEADGTEQYYPLADLSNADQEVLKRLPVGLRLEYPFNYHLTDQAGRALNVQILGRSADQIKFRLATGAISLYALDKLSPASARFLRLLPVNLTGEAATSTAAEPPEAKALRDHIAAMLTENEQLRIHVANPTTPGKQKVVEKQKITDNEAQISLDKVKLDTLLKRSGASLVRSPATQLAPLRAELAGLVERTVAAQKSIDAIPADTSSVRVVQNQSYAAAASSFADQIDSQRSAQQTELDRVRDQIEVLCKEIDPFIDPAPKLGPEQRAKSTWNSVMRQVRSDDQLHKDIAAATPATIRSLQTELRRNQVDLIALLREIKATLGEYTPAAAP